MISITVGNSGLLNSIGIFGRQFSVPDEALLIKKFLRVNLSSWSCDLRFLSLKEQLRKNGVEIDWWSERDAFEVVEKGDCDSGAEAIDDDGSLSD